MKQLPADSCLSSTPDRLLTETRQVILKNSGLWFKSLCHRFFRVPAAQAMLVQSSALVAVFLTVLLITSLSLIRFPFFSLVLMQALLATVVSRWIGMASWWQWIHFGFPIALWGMSMWQVPGEIYLTGFLVSLGLFWTTFRTQVPFYPSRPVIWHKVVELMPQNRSVRMIDIGSGLGDLAMHIANARPDSRVEGIEIAPLPLLVSKIRALIRNSRAIFLRGNYYDLDFGQYDIVFAYLSPAAMPALWKKARHEMRTGSLLISYEFDIPGTTPHYIVGATADANRIYVWKL